MQNTNCIYVDITRPSLKSMALRIMLALVIAVWVGGDAMAQFASESEKAQQIIYCAEMADWKKLQNPNEFTIGVYGQIAEELIPLNALTKGRNICDKPVRVIQFRRKKDMVPTDVLYVNSRYNEELEDLYKYAVQNKSLMITDHAPSNKYFMINLILQNSRQFEINDTSFKKSSASFVDRVQKQGVSTIDMKEALTKKKKDLDAKEQRLNSLRDSISRLEVELEEQTKKNDELDEENSTLLAQLDALERRNEEMTRNAALTIEAVRVRQQQLARQDQDMKRQLNDIDSIESANNKTIQQITQSLEQLSAREREINDATAKIKSGEDAKSTNEKIIIGIVIFTIAVIFLVVLIIKSLRERKRANIKLQQKNHELLQQTKEINEQAAQLENVNKELEKLSIVAGKTQNAIVIMDRNGYFEWVNAGFTRFFGYTLQLLRNELDENIVNVSQNKSIRNILFKCVSNKQTIVFESESATRQGQKLSVQTTLSPILNKKGDVTQLVAIYSDITKLKEQEAAIRSQNEELLQQKNTLEEQKNKIEEQTKSIKAGIHYAQTIQQTILPPIENMQRYFDTFILFRPKDIVSGDFYWFSEAQDGIKSYQFVGDFDCTGHGVPGAFMSLIGNRILNEVINVRRTYSPRDIMDELNVNVVKALKQDQSTNNDGMDTCLCRVEKIALNEYKITFCGAKRPLYYLQTTDDSVQELKGDRKSIGGTQKKRGNIQFTDQELILHSGDLIILCSDGISDQCDKDRKKFSSERLRNIILQNRNEDMNRQGELLSEALDEYRGEEEQRDDISVIGIKFR